MAGWIRSLTQDIRNAFKTAFKQTTFKRITFKNRWAKCKQEALPILVSSLAQSASFIYLYLHSWSLTGHIIRYILVLLFNAVIFSLSDIFRRPGAISFQDNFYSRISFIAFFLLFSWLFSGSTSFNEWIITNLATVIFLLLYFKAQNRSPNADE